MRRFFLAAFLALLPALAFAQVPSVPPVVATATGTTGANASASAVDVNMNGFFAY